MCAQVPKLNCAQKPKLYSEVATLVNHEIKIIKLFNYFNLILVLLFNLNSKTTEIIKILKILALSTKLLKVLIKQAVIIFHKKKYLKIRINESVKTRIHLIGK